MIYEVKMRVYLSTLLILLLLRIDAQDRERVALADEYYLQSELEKARVLYDELAQNRYNFQLIYRNYTDLLKSQNDLKSAHEFLKRINKSFPANIQFQIALASFYNYTLQRSELKNYLERLKKQSQGNPYQLALIGQHLANEKLTVHAIDFYLYARSIRANPTVHALELASLYRMTDEKSKMVEEYLNYAASGQNRLNYIKNLLQNYLQEEEDLSGLEQVLFEKMQEDPENTMYAELMIWLELQRKNFYGAFIQARAIDKRNNSPGDRTMDIGQIALKNNSYDEAMDIFEYVAQNYPMGQNYSIARKLYLNANEQKVKNTYPVQTESIRKLASEYYSLFSELQPAGIAFEALRNKALLHAFYLNEIDSARFYLNELVANPHVAKKLAAESKLDLGDIYLLINEPWESTLLYSQVEKTYKSHPLGYEAKLRNARLNYYTGKFDLAKRHLDILKKNTTRDISNDALALGLLINDNTALDTTDQVMQQFASIELLIFRNKRAEAKLGLEELLISYEFHSISDEVYWVLAKLEIEQGNYQQAIDNLDLILGNYAYDILADDAAFKKAEIHDFYLKNVEEAKAQYQQFLIDYPGSKYVAEARKRFRILRGDFFN